MDEGTYYIVPMTSGVSMVRPPKHDKKCKCEQITDQDGNLSSKAKLVLDQIFFRLDSFEIDNLL